MSSRDVMVIAGLFVAAYFIGMNRKKKIGCNPVVILVTDHRNMIQEFYMLDGLLVTARMRRVNLEEEVDIAELEHHKNYLKGKVGEKGFRALQNAAENIMNYC